MKKLLGLMACVVLLTGCNIKTYLMDDIEIYASAYPIEYITTVLYKEHSTIKSIYPTGVNINEYELTKNQVANYSNAGLFVYAGLMKKGDKNIEAEYASSMIEKSRNIKIIDASIGMEYNNNLEERWLNPSNMLMMANNVVAGLNEYIDNPYLLKDIQKNYDKFKIDLSALDADFKTMYENATTKTIVVSDDAFKFLEKYNFNVISLEENDNLTTKTISDVKTMIVNKQVSYIFVRNDQERSFTIQNIVKQTNVRILDINMLTSITEAQRENKDDYLSLMKNNILQFQMEVYK